MYVQELKIRENESWWGGAVMHGRRMPFGNEDYTLDQFGNTVSNQSQPFFVSNEGRYIWSDDPLHIKFTNGVINVSTLVGEIKTGQSGESLRDAFRFASANFFPPSGKIPDPLLFTHPQYNTWIELQYNQNEEDILNYAENILKNGFPPGVLMIDDTWQSNYGTWTFAADRFSDPKSMIAKLHTMGFKVMLWICPFISADSPIYRKLAVEKLLVFEDEEKTSPAVVRWWNGKSALLDLSNPESRQWYIDQMKDLVEMYGVDGFKLDAGDAGFYKDVYSFNDVSPNDHTELHASIGLEFPLNEYRACWKMAGQPLAQRLQDKGHNWEDLRALIPDMLAQGMIGHPFGCPDMIGGGSFSSFLDDAIMDEELIVRSTQCHALMPMMQFSVAPWRILSEQNLFNCKKMVDLRLKMGPTILQIAKESSKSGEPIVRHMEYMFPGNGYSHIKDQFMLGDKILVAPLVHKGNGSRTISFPPGRWKEMMGEVIVNGPTAKEIDVPLERLPWYQQMD